MKKAKHRASFHWFCYLALVRDSIVHFADRDGLAFAQLRTVIEKAHNFGHTIKNYPAMHELPEDTENNIEATKQMLLALKNAGINDESFTKLKDLMKKKGVLNQLGPDEVDRLTQRNPLLAALPEPIFIKKISELIKRDETIKLIPNVTMGTASNEGKCDFLTLTRIKEKEQIGLSFVRPGDLYALCTRPPMDDDKNMYLHRRWPRSYTSLESEFFSLLRYFFDVCSRSEMKLSEFMAMKLERAAEEQGGEFGNKSHIRFQVNSGRNHTGASYKEYKRYAGSDREWKSMNGDQRKTMAYFIYLEKAFENGAGLVVSFGLGGSETLAFNLLIKMSAEKPGHLFSRLFDRSVFVMAELTMPRKFNRTHTVEESANGWDIEILLEHPITQEEQEKMLLAFPRESKPTPTKLGVARNVKRKPLAGYKSL